jgi:acyl-CoA thioesterase
VSTTRYDLMLPPEWAYGAGVLHGGWLVETAVSRALCGDTDHPHPLAVSAQFVAAPRLGPAVLEVERLRTGRSVSSLRLRLEQEDGVKVEMLCSAGRLPADSDPSWSRDGGPPELPPVEDCIRTVAPAGEPRNGIVEQLDIRLHPDNAGWQQGDGSGGGAMGAWVRSATGREPDALMLLTVADALPPVTYDLGISGWAPTIEYTVLVRALPAPGWLRCVQRAQLLQDGWLDEDCEIWDSRGRLVAQARQLAGYRAPREGTP